MQISTDEFDYGFNSPHWMLKAALMWVPREYLNLAIAKMIDFMVYTEEEWGIQEAFQVLAQYALTGHYHAVGENTGIEVTVESMSEADQDAQIKAFQEFLNSFPDAVDPMVDFKLEEGNPNEKEDK